MDHFQLIKEDFEYIQKEQSKIEDNNQYKVSENLLKILEIVAGKICAFERIEFEDSNIILIFIKTMFNETIIPPEFYKSLLNSLLESNKSEISKNEELFEAYEEFYWLMSDDIQGDMIKLRDILIEYQINGVDKKEDFFKEARELQTYIPIFSKKIRSFFDIYNSYFD